MEDLDPDDVVDYFCAMAGIGIPQDNQTRIWATGVVIDETLRQIESGEAPEKDKHARLLVDSLIKRTEQLTLESLDS